MPSFEPASRIFSWFLGAAVSAVVLAAQPVQAAQTARADNPVPTDPPVQLQLAPATSLGRLAVTPEEKALQPDDEPQPVTLAPISGLPAWDEANFPHYAQLKPAVVFWTQVFGSYSENQSIVHSELAPAKVLAVLDFRGDAAVMTPVALSIKRAKEEANAKLRYTALIKQVNALRNSPEKLTIEQRRIYDLFSDQQDDDKRFTKLLGTLRVQRGLKERTQQALDTASGYLPQMEATFGKYKLPPQLTRLPLVESSFNVEAYSKAGAAGLWQFIPSSARIYMRLDDVVDDRRDPWTSTDAAARHLSDDYTLLGSWPLALTAYNHGRSGIAHGLESTGSSNLPELITRYHKKTFGFAGRNYYAEFLAASDVERIYRARQTSRAKDLMAFDTVETKHYVPYDTLRRLCGADDEVFRKLNPAYRPEVIEGKLYVPPGHIIRVPAGSAKTFEVGYEKLSSNERFSEQRAYFQLHRVKRGDSLARIARQYGVTSNAILSANNIKSGKRLKTGLTLRIPPRVEPRLGPITLAVGEAKPEQTLAQRVAAGDSKDFRMHKVKFGQTLSSIAKRYKITVSSLREANDLGDSSHIKPGMRLKVPTRG